LIPGVNFYVIANIFEDIKYFLHPYHEAGLSALKRWFTGTKAGF